MSDKTWVMKERDWFDPEQTRDGFASAHFEVAPCGDSTWFSGGVTIMDNGEFLVVQMDEMISHDKSEILLHSRNKIAVIRRMLNVAEEALNRYEGEF